MNLGGRKVLLCSCEGSMPVDGFAIAAALGTPEPVIHHQLCRGQIDSYRAALSGDQPVLVACAQEAPLFRDIAMRIGAEIPVFVDIRDRAGWSDQALDAASKMAALLAEGALELETTAAVTLNSVGRILVIGHDSVALEAARRLSHDRTVQLLLTAIPDQAILPPVLGFALWHGRPMRAEGALGTWVVTVEGLASASPSSRSALTFQPAREEASLLRTDVVLDLTGAPSLGHRRDGWGVADPRQPHKVEQAIADARDLMGEFEKPRYIRINSDLCAHSRNGIVACTRCMDGCPTSSIVGKGNSAVVNPLACGGHGGCASACPTGAIRYEFPAGNGIYARLQTLLRTYRDAGGTAPLLLVHDSEHGAETMAGLARFGAGLPARVLPFAVNAVAAMGPEFLLTALALGAARVVLLADPARRDDLLPLQAAEALTNRILDGLGLLGGRVVHLATADPAELGAAVAVVPPPPVNALADLPPSFGKRQMLSWALSVLHGQASAKIQVLDLENGDPFGIALLDQDKCTLCLACVPVCPTHALSGSFDPPRLGFTEAKCVQCGLCRATCPETAIALSPRLSFDAKAAEEVILKQDEAFCCISCGKPFASRAAVVRLTERLSGHSMFAEPGRLNLLKMCEDCRAAAQSGG